MAAKKNSIFNKIKATCDELEMMKMMSFKYDWNEEIIYQFYATFYFDATGQKMMWMIAGQQYDCTVHHFAQMLWLEHQLTMEPEARIHTYNVLKLEEMQFLYAPGAKARPLKI
jgi:phage terminase large subunit